MVSRVSGARGSLLAALLLLVATAGADAQRPQVRRGFWLATSGGVGHTSSDCDQCAGGEREAGSYLSVAMGGTVGRNVLVGAELNSWYLALAEGDESLIGAFTVVQWYPWNQLGMHLRTGVGWSYARSGYRIEAGSGKADKLGLGLRFGAGWDIRIGRMVSLSPFMGIHIAALGATDVGGGTLTNLLTASRQLGLGVTIH